MKFSLFKNIGTARNPEYFDPISYLEMIRDGEWYKLVTELRNIQDIEERKEFKDNMPTCCMSGEFSYRADNKLVTHSGILALDFDHVDNIAYIKQQLAKDKYVFSVYLSAGGDGLRLLLKIVPEKHKEAFKGACEYFWRNYEIAADINGSNVSKPYIVSFDPLVYINYGAVSEFNKYIKAPELRDVPDFIHTKEDFASIVKQIVASAINICESYEDYMKVGFAISESMGESGREYFYLVSQFSNKFNEQKAKKEYDGFLKSRGTNGKIHISSFYYLAKINGINIITEKSKKVIRTTRNAKKAGLNVESIIKNLKENQNIEGVEDLVNKVFHSPEKDQFTDDSTSIIEQFELFASDNYELRTNEISGYIEDNGTIMSDSDLNTMFCNAKRLISKLEYPLMKRILKSDFVPTYNPFFEFLDSDGIPVITPHTTKAQEKKFDSPILDELASCIDNDDPAYTNYFLRKWMVGIVSSMHKVHSPLILALLGPQLSGKTEFIRRLLPIEISSKYYAEDKFDKEKDSELLMCENILMLDDEHGSRTARDAAKLKSLTSKQFFYIRRPYGDHNEKILRIAVLAFTANRLDVLNDSTGNRRILPIFVRDIDKEKFNSINKRDLLLECFKLYKKGFDWQVRYDDLKLLNKDEERYSATVKERQLLEKYFMPYKGEGAVTLTTTEILVEIELMTKQKISMNVLGSELIRCGYEKKSVRNNKYGDCQKKWQVARINRDESAALNTFIDPPF